MSVVAEFAVDPDEFADAVRDGMTAGGASPREANVEADLGWLHAVAHNNTTDAQRLALVRIDPADVRRAARIQAEPYDHVGGLGLTLPQRVAEVDAAGGPGAGSRWLAEEMGRQTREWVADHAATVDDTDGW